MAKLYFYYSSMNAGKSTALLQSSYNYRERGMHTLILAPHLDDRYGIGKVTSRIGLESAATTFKADEDLLQLITALHDDDPLDCVLVDEAQFLSKEQVFQLGEVTDELNIPVLAYGLRTDFRTELFEGSRRLFEVADRIEEVKVTCQYCNRKAIFNMRLADGEPVIEGDQVQLGADESYLPVCYGCYADRLPFDGLNPAGPAGDG